MRILPSPRRIVMLIVILVLVIVLVPPILDEIDEITTIRYINTYEGCAHARLTDILGCCIYELRTQSEGTSIPIVPSNIVLRALEEYCKDAPSYLISTNGLPLDPWGNPYYISFHGFIYPTDAFPEHCMNTMEPTIRNDKSPLDKSQPKHEKGKDVFVVWSSGKNGINEWGKGDDIRIERPVMLLNHLQRNDDEP